MKPTRSPTSKNFCRRWTRYFMQSRHEAVIARVLGSSWRQRTCLPVVFLMMAGTNMAHANDVTLNAASALQAKHAELAGKLDNNAFQKPLYLESSQTSNELKADVYARLSHPFATARSELNQPERWCDILILHPNTKYCRASGA